MGAKAVAPLDSIVPKDGAARRAFEAIVHTRSFRAEAWLLEAGDRAEQCFLITRGLVRELYVSDSGKEHTRSFVAAGDVTGSLIDLVSNEPAVTWIQALEPTETLAWRYRDFDALTQKFPELERIARQNAERLAVKKTRREYEMLALTAKERYARWMASQPDLDGRVSRRMLASYLGITPEHLSRLRRPASNGAPRREKARRPR